MSILSRGAKIGVTPSQGTERHVFGPCSSPVLLVRRLPAAGIQDQHVAQAVLDRHWQVFNGKSAQIEALHAHPANQIGDMCYGHGGRKDTLRLRGGIN